MCAARGITTLVDGSQAVYHMAVDVQALGCDFYVFTGHKLYGPTGIGVLYGREALLDLIAPVQGGGDMIASVTFEKSTWAPLPARLEAGTPHIAGAVGLGAAVDYIESLGREAIAEHEQGLLAYATARLDELPGVTVVGRAREKASVLSFTMDGIHPHDIGTVLDSLGVCIRAGHHCAQPLMQCLGVVATARASFAAYNTAADVDALADGLVRARELFG